MITYENFMARFIKILTFLTLLSWDLYALGQAEVNQNPDAEEPSVEEEGSFISDGSRVAVDDKGFSIVPPLGWRVFVNRVGLSLLMEIPYSKELPFQRTIQVMAFNEPVYLNEHTVKRYSDLISRKFSENSSSILDYNVRSDARVQLQDGREGVLYYSDFTINGLELMQAHLLVSSATRHYLITYTDVAVNFDENISPDYLQTSWEAMSSLELDSSTPQRYAIPLYIFLAALALTAIATTLALAERRKVKRKVATVEDGLDKTPIEDDDAGEENWEVDDEDTPSQDKNAS